jgi:hypothetical protein
VLEIISVVLIRDALGERAGRRKESSRHGPSLPGSSTFAIDQRHEDLQDGAVGPCPVGPTEASDLDPLWRQRQKHRPRRMAQASKKPRAYRASQGLLGRSVHRGPRVHRGPQVHRDRPVPRGREAHRAKQERLQFDLPILSATKRPVNFRAMPMSEFFLPTAQAQVARLCSTTTGALHSDRVAVAAARPGSLDAWRGQTMLLRVPGG